MMIVADGGVKDVIEIFSFQFEDDLIEHDFVLLIDMQVLSNKDWRVSTVLILFEHDIDLSI